MIIATAKSEDEKSLFLLLGLSRENVTHLMAGQPIRVKRETHGNQVPAGWTIGIIFGETELEMKKKLESEGLIDGNTKFQVDPRL